MNKNNVISCLEKAGIKVESGKIAKADVEKAKQIILASTTEDLQKALESVEHEAAQDILSDLSVRSIYSSSDKDDLYWDTVALLDMLDPQQYVYINTSTDSEGIRHVFKKSDLPKVIEALSKANS